MLLRLVSNSWPPQIVSDEDCTLPPALLCPYMAEGGRAKAPCQFPPAFQDTDPIHGAAFEWPNHLLKAPPLNTVAVGLKFQQEFWKQCIQRKKMTKFISSQARIILLYLISRWQFLKSSNFNNKVCQKLQREAGLQHSGRPRREDCLSSPVLNQHMVLTCGPYMFTC